MPDNLDTSCSLCFSECTASSGLTGLQVAPWHKWQEWGSPWRERLPWQVGIGSEAQLRRGAWWGLKAAICRSVTAWLTALLSAFFQYLGQLTSVPGYLNPSSRTEILHFIDNAKVTTSC